MNAAVETAARACPVDTIIDELADVLTRQNETMDSEPVDHYRAASLEDRANALWGIAGTSRATSPRGLQLQQLMANHAAREMANAALAMEFKGVRYDDVRAEKENDSQFAALDRKINFLTLGAYAFGASLGANVPVVIVLALSPDNPVVWAEMALPVQDSIVR